MGGRSRSQLRIDASECSDPSGNTIRTLSKGHTTWALVITYPPSINTPLPVNAGVSINATEGDTLAKTCAAVSGAGVGTGVGKGVGVEVGVGVGVAVVTSVAVGKGVGVAIRTGVGVTVGIGVAVGDGVTVGVGAGASSGARSGGRLGLRAGCANHSRQAKQTDDEGTSHGRLLSEGASNSGRSAFRPPHAPHHIRRLRQCQSWCLTTYRSPASASSAIAIRSASWGSTVVSAFASSRPCSSRPIALSDSPRLA